MLQKGREGGAKGGGRGKRGGGRERKGEREYDC